MCPKHKGIQVCKRSTTQFKSHTVPLRVGDISIPLSPQDRSSRQKTKQINVVTNRYYKPNGFNWCLENIYPNTKGYTLFSVPHGTFTKIDYMLEHKASLRKYKKFEITIYILSDHHQQIKSRYWKQQKASILMNT